MGDRPVSESTELSRPAESADRLPAPDVVRALALFGVMLMNYNGYLRLRSDPLIDRTSLLERLFNPFGGPFATRFAATFVLTAGVGITLLTRRVVAQREAGDSGAAEAVTEMRWRLVRRGMALYVFGQVLDVIWPGTIIIYYGAMFAVGALLFTLASRWVIAVGVVATAAAWAIEAWSFRRVEVGADISWLTSPGDDTVRRFVIDLAVNGTHPLLPWLVFLCAGIVLGRLIHAADWELPCIGVGLLLFGTSALVSAFASTPFSERMLSLDPFDRGALYVASALGTALLAYATISWIVRILWPRVPQFIDPLRRAGQMSLTIYFAHIIVFNFVVDWLGWVEPGGVGTAIVFALVFWVVAIAGAAWWNRQYGRGPLERVYRAIGG
jgi:uncharacterized membrane protein YeiB